MSRGIIERRRRGRTGIWARWLAAAFVAGSVSGCGSVDALNSTVKNATTMGAGVLQDGIDKISGNLSSWQTVLQDMEKKLIGDTQSTLRNEVSTLLQGSIAVANASVQCDIDFIGHRVLQTLQRRAASVTGEKADVLEPSACTVVPGGIDYAAWRESRILKADVFGYDFDADGLTLSLLTGTTRTDLTSRLTKTSSYNMTINLGGDPNLFNGQQQTLQVIWRGDFTKPVSEIPILLPVTPLCETRKVTIPPVPPVSYFPPHVGGDRDFGGAGPRIVTQVGLSSSVVGTVHATIFMSARETRSDFTEVQGKLRVPLFNVEPGWRIDHLITPSLSPVDVFVASGHDLIPRNPGPPVQQLNIQGDTDAEDVGRTGVTVHFTSIDVWEVQTGDCLNPAGAVELLRSSDGLSAPVRSQIEGAMKCVSPGFVRSR